MLILTRNEGESLLIGEETTVTILGIKRGQVRVGIDAPREINVVRTELLERNKQEKKGRTKITLKKKVFVDGNVLAAGYPKDK